MPLFSGPKWDIDTTLKLFIMNFGETDLDVQVDLYSDWKELYATNSELRKYPEAIRTVGGDPISDIQNLGDTYFLMNGYKIRPHEASHTLEIDGNLFTDPAGGDKVVPTLGSFTVLVNNTVSNLVDSAVARLDLTQLLPAVFIDADNGDDTAAGTPTAPVKTVAVARVIADAENLKEYRFRGAITLTEDHEDWAFLGQAAEDSNIISLGGFSVDKSKFESCRLTGSMTGVIQANECDLQILSGAQGKFRRCGLSATITVASGSTLVLDSCFSELAGNSTPIVDVNNAAFVNFRNYSGGLELQEVHDGSVISVDLDPGHLIIDSTCDGGEILVRGHGHLTNNADEAASPSIAIIKRGLMDGEDVRDAVAALVNDADTSLDDTTVTIYDEDGRVGGVKRLEYDISADKRQRTRTL
jgi:hypothetical protein